MLFYPLLKQVERHRQAYEHYLKMSMEAILLLQERHHPHYVESVLRAYLPLVRSPIPPRPQPVAQPQQPSGFQAALEREQQAPAQAPQQAPQQGAMPMNDGRPLSADQLRRFRPIGGDQNPS